MTHSSYIVKNQLLVEADSETVPTDFIQALESELATEESKIKQLNVNTFQFNTQWEPPFKTLRQLSKRFPQLRLTLFGDAFKVQHWICKATIAEGKIIREETLTRNDGLRFDTVFEELYGEPYYQWEQRQE